MLIVNQSIPQNAGVIVDKFGDYGAARIVPINGETPGDPFILDPEAVRELIAALELIVR